MAQNDMYDDGLNIHDLIKEAEESGSFSDYLERVGRAKTEWQSQTSSATTATDPSSPSTSGPDATDRSASTSAAPAIAPRDDQRTELEKYPGIATSEARPASPIPPTPTDFPVDPPPVAVAPPIQEFTEKTEVHTHPFVGTYSSTQQVVVERTEELDSIYINAFNKGVTDMGPEQILHIIHQLRDQIVKTKRAEQGLASALEHHIGKMNLQEKGIFLEKQRSYRPKKASDSTGEKKSSAPRKVASAGSDVDKKDAKTVQTLKSLLTKDQCVDEMQKRGKLTDSLKAYIDKVYA
jgi:hypothetical protein